MNVLRLTPDPTAQGEALALGHIVYLVPDIDAPFACCATGAPVDAHKVVLRSGGPRLLVDENCVLAAVGTLACVPPCGAALCCLCTA